MKGSWYFKERLNIFTHGNVNLSSELQEIKSKNATVDISVGKSNGLLGLHSLFESQQSDICCVSGLSSFPNFIAQTNSPVENFLSPSFKLISHSCI